MGEPVPVNVPIEIRWRDLDALGHVNNAVYLSYLEQARTKYLEALTGDPLLGDQRTPWSQRLHFILAEVTCRFRSPATHGDQPVVEIYVSQVGRKSFVFEYRISDRPTGRLIADACSTQVWYDYEAGQSLPVPEEIVRRMETLQSAPIPRVTG